jgi:hypothetical protein
VGDGVDVGNESRSTDDEGPRVADACPGWSAFDACAAADCSSGSIRQNVTIATPSRATASHAQTRTLPLVMAKLTSVWLFGNVGAGSHVGATPMTGIATVGDSPENFDRSCADFGSPFTRSPTWAHLRRGAGRTAGARARRASGVSESTGGRSSRSSGATQTDFEGCVSLAWGLTSVTGLASAAQSPRLS